MMMRLHQCVGRLSVEEGIPARLLEPHRLACGLDRARPLRLPCGPNDRRTAIPRLRRTPAAAGPLLRPPRLPVQVQALRRPTRLAPAPRREDRASAPASRGARAPGLAVPAALGSRG